MSDSHKKTIRTPYV